MKTIGYKPAYFQKPGEISIVRQLGRNDYPRFHLYIKPFGKAQGETNSFVFNLHLDQKKSSYKGVKGHSGEYGGELIVAEVERIKSLLV